MARPFRALLTAALIGAAATCALAQPRTAQAIDIPASALAQALRSLAQQTGVTIEFDAALVEAKSSAALKAALPIDEALARLLAGSGLQATPTAAGFRIATAAAAPAQEVVITGKAIAVGRANRSASGLLDVPEQEKPRAIDLISGERLRNQIAGGEDDLLRNVPGAVNNSFGRGQGVRILLRGLNAGITLDGVSLGNNSVNVEPELIESVEVQRGVNGLETAAISYGFGGGAGGSINLLRKYPKSERFTEVFANGDQWGRWRVGVDANLPLGERNQGLRLIAAEGRNKSYFRNESDQDTYRVLSLAGTWSPLDALVVDAAADYVREQSPLSYYLSDVNGDYSVLPRIDRRQSYSAPWSYGDNEVKRFTTKWSWLLNDDWTVEANLRQDRTREYRNDFYYFFGADLRSGDADTVAFLTDGDSNYRRRVTVADINLKGSLRTGDVRHLLAVGASRYDSRDLPGGSPSYFGDVGPNNIYAWVPPLRPVPASLGEPSGEGSTTRVEDRSAFFQWRATFAERYDLWLGGRHSKYSTTVSGGSRSTEPAIDEFFTPIVSLAWRPNSQHTFYVTRAESVTPGLIVSDEYANAGDILRPQRVRQSELGWKWQAKEHGVSVALFRTEEPRQAEIAAEDDSQLARYEIDGFNRFRGIELGGNVRLSKVKLQGGVVWLDGVLEASRNSSLNGTPSPGIARRTAYLSADIDNAFVPGLDLGASWRVQSSSLLYSEIGRFSTPGYAVVDAYASYRIGSEASPLTLRLAVSNLFDRYYYANYDNGFSFFPGAPRTVRVELSKRL
jgi:iron complex outermembrane recepter protein